MSKIAEVDITYKEIHYAIRKYVEEKYGVSSTGSIIHYVLDRFNEDVLIKHATVKYTLKETR